MDTFEIQRLLSYLNFNTQSQNNPTTKDLAGIQNPEKRSAGFFLSSGAQGHDLRSGVEIRHNRSKLNAVS
ncbi:MAG: hypothetical protein J5711_06680 [Bacteroidales bacterium]|nr:hypothetical protein [Bacteroidales bacterium]